jgi:hypothetical protein
MNVEQLIQRIRQLDRNAVVFVETSRELSPETSVVLVPLGDDDEPDYLPSGFDELMDVWQVQELLRSQAELNGVANPSSEQKIEWLLERLQAQGWSPDGSALAHELPSRHSGGGGYRRISHGDHDA